MSVYRQVYSWTTHVGVFAALSWGITTPRLHYCPQAKRRRRRTHSKSQNVGEKYQNLNKHGLIVGVRRALLVALLPYRCGNKRNHDKNTLKWRCLAQTPRADWGPNSSGDNIIRVSQGQNLTVINWQSNIIRSFKYLHWQLDYQHAWFMLAHSALYQINSLNSKNRYC